MANVAGNCFLVKRFGMCLTHSLGNARWADGGDGFLWWMLLGGSVKLTTTLGLWLTRARARP